jgi:threonine dehydratase
MNDLFQRIEEAHRAIRPQVSVTPLAFSPMLSKATGCDVYLKCEHLQHTGSFKFRGATNKLRLLDADARRNGVLTVSSGNHGQGVALAGKLAGVPVIVYASTSAAAIKLDAIRALGAEVVTLNDTTLAVELEAARQAKLRGMAFVSPYNDLDVIAGQGTIGMELHEQAKRHDCRSGGSVCLRRRRWPYFGSRHGGQNTASANRRDRMLALELDRFV